MITKEQAQNARNFEHITLKGGDKQPIRCRATGKCQVWKTRPNEFKLPVKHGLYHSFYITQDNANEWTAK
jgi:hypothetical protein